jgi:hypothetical protein
LINLKIKNAMHRAIYSYYFINRAIIISPNISLTFKWTVIAHQILLEPHLFVFHLDNYEVYYYELFDESFTRQL